MKSIMAAACVLIVCAGIAVGAQSPKRIRVVLDVRSENAGLAARLLLDRGIEETSDRRQLLVQRIARRAQFTARVEKERRIQAIAFR